MPYQIGFSHRQRLFSQVTLRTAGEDQTHICTPTIYLEGIVDGDLSGHTIEWEQIGGSLVTLINGTTLTPHFDAVDSTDKTFRLWLDRGTPFEQFDDVRILKTPTDFCSTGFNDNQPSITLGFDPSPVDCSDITAFVNVSVPPPTSLTGEEPGNSIVVEVSWEHPIDNTRFLPYIEQYKVIENGTLEVMALPPAPIPDAGDGTGPPSGTKQYDGTFATYRVDTYYNISGMKFVRESCTQDFSTLPQPLVKAYNDNVPAVSYSPDQQNFSRVRFGFIFRTGEDPLSVTFNPDQQNINITRYSFLSVSEGSDPVSTTFNSEQPYINITRYGGSGIGGG